MIKRYTLALILSVSLLSLQTVCAAIELPAIISSNMVLQRNAAVKLWGWADAGEEITIQASWINTAMVIKADDKGNWAIELNTTDSKDPQTIHFKSTGSQIALSNILFGEVWLCSGQSNMEQPVKGYNAEPVFGSPMAIAKAYNPNLRLFTVHKAGSGKAEADVAGYNPWQQATPGSVAEFSAVAYYFGQQLQEILDCPVGLIHSSYGASRVEAWMSAEVLGAYQTINIEDIDIRKSTHEIPTVLFNAMISPLIPFALKGVLWYQGESNRMEPQEYKVLFPEMVKDWRNRWDIGDFPFYYVQIAPFLYYGDNEEFQTANNSAFIRESQLHCLSLIPNSGIAIALDVGDAHFIHPPKKREVADRLLFNALNKTYGIKAIDGDSPEYDSMEVKDGGIILKFRNAETGLFTYKGLTGFEIAGADKVFYKAKATIVNYNQVFVTSENVPNPVAVRYAWSNWVEGTLYDANLLPASSFRTDKWMDAIRK